MRSSTFRSPDPTRAIARLRMPVLLVAGSLDRQVPPSLNLPPIRRALASKRLARIVVLPDLNHVLQPAVSGMPSEYAKIETTIDERVLTVITGFVEAAVGAALSKKP